jgi:hypothetical protein
MIVDSIAIDKMLWPLAGRRTGVEWKYCRAKDQQKKVALMAGETARRASMMGLQQLYRIYTTIAGKPGEPVPLSAFKFSKEETEKLFSMFDEDYHISRFFHFSDVSGEKYFIDGENATHIAIDPEISSIF